MPGEAPVELRPAGKAAAPGVGVAVASRMYRAVGHLWCFERAILAN